MLKAPKIVLNVFLAVFFSASFLFYSNQASASSETGEINNVNKYVWGENVGWINFNPNGSVQVKDYFLTGYIWGENVGWIKLDPSLGGVINDGEGTLTGYAWGENVGWINFRPTGGGVSIDKQGVFSGYAWGENVGWISFSGSIVGGGTYGVTTDWRPISGRQIIVAPPPPPPAPPPAPPAPAPELPPAPAPEPAPAPAPEPAPAPAAKPAPAPAPTPPPAPPPAPPAPAPAPTPPPAPAGVEIQVAPVGIVSGPAPAPIIIIPVASSGSQTIFVGEQAVIKERAVSAPAPAPITETTPEITVPTIVSTREREYVIRPMQITDNSVDLSISSEGEVFRLSVNLRETKAFDFDQDGTPDITINLNDIKFFEEPSVSGEVSQPTVRKREATLTFQKIAAREAESVVVKEREAGLVETKPIVIEDTVDLLTFSKSRGTNQEGFSITEDPQPTLKGTTNIKNANIYIRIQSKMVTGFTRADSNGYWEWTVPEPLEPGKHSVRVTAEDPINTSRQVTQTSEFELVAPAEKSKIIQAVTVVPAEAIMPTVDVVKGMNAANEAIKSILPAPVAKFYEKNVQKAVVEPAAKFYQQEVIENETVQIVNQEVAAPVVTVSVVTNTVTSVPAVASSLAPALNYLLQFLKLLFTEPAYLLAKRRKKWGLVYDALTKQPVSLATIRLFEIDAQGRRKIISTKVTGPDGRYLFIVEPNKQYSLQITKPDYIYPSKLLGKVSHDGNYEQLYYGENIVIKGQSPSPTAAAQPPLAQPLSPSSAAAKIELTKEFISFNIPLDPIEGKATSVSFTQKVKTSVTNLQQLVGLSREKRQREYQAIVRQAIKRRLSKSLAYVGPLITLVSYVISPGLYALILLCAHLIFLIIFKKLAVKPSSKPWGEVFNIKKPKEKLDRAIIRLFDSQYGRLLLTQVTSANGYYGFLVGNEKYILTCEKPNFILPGEKIEIVGRKEEMVKRDIGMEPVAAGKEIPPAKPLAESNPPAGEPSHAKALTVIAPSENQEAKTPSARTAEIKPAEKPLAEEIKQATANKPAPQITTINNQAKQNGTNGKSPRINF